MTKDLQGAPLILEVRANEFASKDPNAHVPLGADEMIADAVATEKAGATVYHWHPQDADGADGGVDLQAAVIAGVREQTGLLLHATLGFTATQGDAKSRMASVDGLEDRGLRPDFIPVDIGALVSDTWNAGENRFSSDDAVLLNKTGYLVELLTEITRRKYAVEAVIWSPGGVRTALRMRDLGLLSMPVYWQLGFTGPEIPGGMPPTAWQLDAFLEELPAGEPWNIHVRNGDGLALATHAILRGGHVAIGLGDDPYTRLGSPTNAALMTRLAAVAETIGRPIANPEQARSILGITG
jgi:3-keto-5-aminohexanoate cleavage enzyme